MRTHQSRRRSVARMLDIAALAGLGFYHNTADDKGGGGTDDKAKAKPEIPAEEVERIRAEARAAAKAEHEAEREKEKKAAEAEDARKRGEFEKLYQGETTRAKELEQQLAAARLDSRKQAVALKLQRHLAADHKDYIENDVDILPHITIDADTPDDEIQKRIKAATDAFVKRTPKASPLNGAPSGARRGKIEGGDAKDDRLDRSRNERVTGPVTRF